MKLELKHIVGYLPYALKCKNTFGNIVELKGIGNISKNQFNWNFKDHNQDLIGYSYECKPILYPMSDISKEIKINLQQFTPIKELNKIFGDVEIYVYMSGKLEINKTTEDYSQQIDFFDGYEIVDKLYEWHFDIHGLIEAGLAIDINTLNP